MEDDDLAVFIRQWLRRELAWDVAPAERDHAVNLLDWAVFAQAWQSTTDIYDLDDFTDQWLQHSAWSADIAPLPNGDDIVNMLDFARFIENWRKSIEE